MYNYAAVIFVISVHLDVDMLEKTKNFILKPIAAVSYHKFKMLRMVCAG